MSKELQITEAIENKEANLQYLASLSDGSLSAKLDEVHLQMQLAEQKKNTAALNVLEVWRNQIIEARVLKQEDSIPDGVNEMEEAVSNIETITVASEERKQLLNQDEEEEESLIRTQKRVTAVNSESQLNLF